MRATTTKENGQRVDGQSAEGRAASAQDEPIQESGSVPSPEGAGNEGLGNEGAVDEALIHTQRLAGIGTLAASVAHELTNPISIITATVSNLRNLIQDQTLSTEELLRYLDIVDQNAWRSARLIQTLREYSHPSRLELMPYNLNQIVEHGLTLVAYSYSREANVEIKADLAPDLKPVCCDPNQIIQVLINLLSNAYDAIEGEGGTIFIRTWAVADEEAVAFSVSDTGPGVEPSILQKVFEPFVTTKTLGDGMGLGLAVAAGIVRRHEGRIEVENNSGLGATFTVILPTRPGGPEGDGACD